MNDFDQYSSENYPCKVSIIIPVHNAEEYLRTCIESALNQTLSDLEVICVDDFSSDNSFDILKEYASRDERIKLIHYAENKSSSQARKDGVLSAQGRYIMFLDADDSLELTACEKLTDLMDKTKVDILQFGTFVDAVPTVKRSSVAWFENFTKPYEGVLQGKAVFEACFRDKKYRFNLWNKIYTSVLCKKAFSFVDDGCIPKAQDLYAFFILSWFANSYYGINEKLYHYNYGRGITGGAHKTTLKQFKRHCSQNIVSKKCKNFLVSMGVDREYNDVCESIDRGLLSECIGHFVRKIEPAIASEALDILLNSWQEDQIVNQFKTAYAKYRSEIIVKIPKEKALSLESLKDYYFDRQNVLVDENDSIVPKEFRKLTPIVLATNDKYSPCAGVVIQSIIDHAKPDTFYRVYILQTNVSKNHIDSLESMSNFQVRVQCLDPSYYLNLWKVELYERAHYTKETFYRFLIPEIFYFYEKVIYLDCDVFVNTDISEILDDTARDSSFLVAAVKNELRQKDAMRVIESFGISPFEYFNAGIMVINNKKWLLENIVEECFYCLQNIPKQKLVYLDQDILNIVCRSNTHYLSPDWNFRWHLVYGLEELQVVYEPIIKKYHDSFKILHFSSNRKPWVHPEFPLSKYFWQVARRTVFYEEFLQNYLLVDNKLLTQENKKENNESCEKSKAITKKITTPKGDNDKRLALANQKIESLSRDLKSRQKKIDSLTNSWSYKSGRVLTFLPRRFRDTIYCLHKHGFLFTIKRIAVHLKLISG